MIVPRIVLHPERGRHVGGDAAPRKVYIGEPRIIDVLQHVYRQAQLGGTVACGRRQFCGLHLDTLEAVDELVLAALGALLRQIQHLGHQHVHRLLLRSGRFRTRAQIHGHIADLGRRRAGVRSARGLIGADWGRDDGGGVLQLLREAAGEDERGQGVDVREDDDGVHHFGHGPAEAARSLGQRGDVLGSEEPGPMGEYLVDLADGQQFLGDVVEALQPRLVPSVVDELPLEQLHKVRAAMPSSSLEEGSEEGESVDAIEGD